MKICVITSTRADFGLLRYLMQRIDDSLSLELQVVATGAHLLEEFGSTSADIQAAGLSIDWEVRGLTEANEGLEVAHQVGQGISGFTAAFDSLKPDLVVIVGDRYEMLSAAISAFFLEIPIAHLHGGEVTHGAFDDTIRHAITKFSRIHFVATEDYAQRIIYAGEDPASVHVVGGLGVDEITRTALLSEPELENELGIALSRPLFLVTYHPVTAAKHDSQAEIDDLIEALGAISGATVIFTMPGADPEHQVIEQSISRAVAERGAPWHVFTSLGHQRYLSLLAIATAVVGNSSSGLLEAPTFQTPAINIGPRQSGRHKAKSVINAEPTAGSIAHALDTAMSSQFLESIRGVVNPYGSGGAVDRIMSILEGTDIGSLGNKIYFDATPNVEVNQHGE